MIMADLSLKLTAFEGPLDLLMHLIERDKIDIYDIPIVSITEQYLAYLQGLQEFDMEIASEFLVMAATLLQIKSRMLLPKEEQPEDEEEPDPRQQLVEMLLEYKRIKAMALKLSDLKAAAEVFVTRPAYLQLLVKRKLAPYTVGQLIEAYAGLTGKEQLASAYIEPQTYSVAEKITSILEALALHPEGMSLQDFCGSGHRGEQVAAFLGVLELLKEGLIYINQTEAFGPIYIFGKEVSHGNNK